MQYNISELIDMRYILTSSFEKFKEKPMDIITEYEYREYIELINKTENNIINYWEISIK